MAAYSALSSLPSVLTLCFRPGGDPGISGKLEALANRLERESSGRVRVVRAAEDERGYRPALRIDGSGTSRIDYHFVPHGREEEAFVDLLRSRAEREPEQNTASGEDVSGPEPVEALLFVADACPNCPRAVRALHALALDPAPPHLHVHLFEATLSPELAGRHGVKSVPTLLVGDRLRFVGPPDPARLAGLLRSGDESALIEEQIRQQIRWGEAPEAGRKIAEMPDAGFLVRDLERSTFQERVGWLLALEEALESRPGCLDPLVPELARLLDRAEPALRGDLADLLGTIGNIEALPALERLAQDPNPDVADAAADALERIREQAPDKDR